MKKLLNSKYLFEIIISFIVFCMPIFVKAIFNLPRLMLQNFTDGVFYLGYAMHFRELVDRVGLNYYAVRFGAIFPDALAFSLLGPVAGFSALRYTFSGLCCLVLYISFKSRFESRLVGFFAAVLWVFNPAAIRLLQTGYVDVAGSFFILIGVGLVLIPQSLWILNLLAGICFGMAFWSHLHAGFALFFLLPLLFVLRYQNCWKTFLFAFFWMLVGGILVTFSGVLFYGLNFGLWDITSPTREYLRLLTEEGLAARWSLPWGKVMLLNTFWLVPIPLLMALLASKNRTPLVLYSYLGLVGYIGFLLYGDVFKGGFSLSMFYYFSFVLAALVIFQAVVAAQEIKANPWMAIVLGIAVVFPPISVKVFPSEWLWRLAIPFCLVLVFSIAFIVSHKSWRSATLAAMFAVNASLVSLSGSSRLALGNYWNKDDIGLLAIGQKLAMSLPCYQDDPASMVFWYKNEDGSDAKMLQSLYLHNFTLLQNSPDDFVPFAPLEVDAVKTLKKRGIKHIIILDKSEDVLDEGIGYLMKAGLDFEKLRKFSITEKNETFQIAHVILKDEESFETREIDIKKIDTQKQAFTAELSDGLKITTAPVKWNFDGFLNIPPLEKNCGLRLSFTILKGDLYLGLYKNQSPEGEIASRHFAANKGEIETIFDPALCDEAKFICIRNSAPNGVSSEIIFHDVKELKFLEPSKK